MALRRPDAYASAMQEDRVIEWLSVIVFAAAGIALAVHAWRRRRWFDLLVALFLVFVAGEEMSWGQRLLGLTPPSYFLAHNTQQEINVHNFAGVFGSPKGPFTLVLAGYAILLPLAASVASGRRVLDRIGATPPPAGVIAWLLVAIALFIWYPFRFTGEWTELLAGSAFLMAAPLRPRSVAAFAPLAVGGAVALTVASAHGRQDPARVACAAAELRAIGHVAREELAAAGSTHKRVWTLVEEGRLPADALHARVAEAPCAGDDAASRRRFMVDPWGTAYWVRVEPDDVARRLTVYSFGPNRRRDGGTAASSGDDLILIVEEQRH